MKLINYRFSKILILVAGCFVVLLAIFFVVLSRYDFSGTIEKVTNQVYENTGRYLEIKGKTSLDIGFTPRLVLRDLSFENADWSETPVMIKSDRFEVELELLPLIIGKVVVKRIGLINSDILIEISQHGVSNFNFNPRQDSHDEKNTRTIDSTRFFVKHFFVQNCNILYRKAGMHAPLQFDIQHLHISGDTVDSPVAIDLKAGYGHFLSVLNLNAGINIQALALGKMTVDEINATVAIHNGEMDVSVLAASAYNARVTGSLHLNAVKDNLGATAALDISNLDTHVLCTDLKINKGLKGPLNAGFRLRGTGSNLSGIMANLSGDAWVTMVDGHIENGFVQSLGSDYFTKFLGFLNPFDEKAASNQLNCAAARIECQNGIGTIKLLLADMPLMAATGGGRIDFRNETLDISVIPVPKKGIGGPNLGNIHLSPGNLARAFKISGTFASPEIKLDNAEVAQSLLKAAGGIVLLGPVGIAGILVGTGKAQKDPCPCAVSFAMDGNDDACEAIISEAGKTETSNPLKKIFNIFD